MRAGSPAATCWTRKFRRRGTMSRSCGSKTCMCATSPAARERQLTRDGGATIHNAEAEFVAQEEMDQRSGYWWAPDDSAIAFKRFDEAQVPLARRVEIYASRTDLVEQRYPGAGDPNVLVTLALVAPESGATRQVDLGSEQDIYLVRADWSADSRTLTYQRQSRDQHRLQLMAVDAATLAQRTLLTETADTWVNVQQAPHFLKQRNALLWVSERSGHKHLYLFDLDGRLLHPVTRGDWGIDQLLAVDEQAGRVYLSANRDAVIDQQIYALALDGSSAERPQRVSQADGWHEAKIFPVTANCTSIPGPIPTRRRKSVCAGPTAACWHGSSTTK
ncbi:DPP IV N-terminal domain-containing protein [Undibacterium arcticum]